MHLLQSFDKTFIVNLASRKDRRIEMTDQLTQIGIDAADKKIEIFNAIRPENAAGFPSIGAHGCFASHLNILKQAAACRFESILILEDDLNFSSDFNGRNQAICALLGVLPWSMFYGGYRLDGAESLPAEDGCIELPAQRPLLCTHFIAFRGVAIANAASYLEAMLQRAPGDPEGGPMHVDGAYGWFRKANPLHRTFVASPELGYQRSSRTDIHSPRWFDRTPGVREVAGLIRSRRNRLKTSA